MASPPLSSNALGLELLRSMWVEFSIIIAVIGLRLYTRTFLVRRFAWDDFWMLSAFLVTLGAFVFNSLSVNAGFGLHAEDLAPPLVVAVVKWAFLGQVLGILGSALARMAFITTLVYLLSPTQRIHLWLLGAFFAAQVVMNSVTALYILLQCRLTYGLWDHTVGAVCAPPYIQEHIGFAQGTVNSFSDLALAIFPATVIWKLNMKRSIKISLCVSMGLGVLAFATAVIKTVSLTEINSAPTDLTFIMFGNQFWFCIENCTLIISATIPTLRPLFTRRKVREHTFYNANGLKSRQRRWNGTCNDGGIAAQRSISVASDELELTSADRGDFGSTDTECVASAEGEVSEARQEGIVKTIDACVTY